MREARVAAASVASMAPRMASTIQMTADSMETRKGSGAYMNTFPNPAPRTAVSTSAVMTVTSCLVTAHNQQDQDERDHPERLHPAQCAGVAVSWISHEPLLSRVIRDTSLSIQSVIVKSKCIDIVTSYVSGV